MEDVPVSWDDTQDILACVTSPRVYMKYSRDPERTPMQWDCSRNSGFSSGSKTWLPVSTHCKQLSVERQLQPKLSHLNIYKTSIALKNQFRLPKEKIETVIDGNDILMYQRSEKLINLPKLLPICIQSTRFQRGQ